MKKESRPVTPLEKFNEALELAELSEEEKDLIDYIRYTGVFSQPMITRDLKLKSKPPALSSLCVACRKIGIYMPKHFSAVREWSASINKNVFKCDGELVCSATSNIDGDFLTPEDRTSLYDFLAVHKELFTGFS